MKCLNIHSCNSRDFEDFFRLKMERETREEKHNYANKKENEKDVKKTYNKQFK